MVLLNNNISNNKLHNCSFSNTRHFSYRVKGKMRINNVTNARTFIRYQSVVKSSISTCHVISIAVNRVREDIDSGRTALLKSVEVCKRFCYASEEYFTPISGASYLLIFTSLSERWMSWADCLLFLYLIVCLNLSPLPNHNCRSGHRTVRLSMQILYDWCQKYR